MIDALDVFTNSGDNKMQTRDLISRLCIDDEKPWATFHRGQNIAPFVLGRMLKPFGISSTNIRFDGRTKKGFYQAEFEDAVARYAPEKAATPATSATFVTGEADPK